MVRAGGATASPSDPGYVRVDRREGVARVTLDHPAERNALSLTTTRALAEAVHQLTADERVGAMVLSATGTVFSAGGSVDDLLEPRAPLREMYAGFVASDAIDLELERQQWSMGGVRNTSPLSGDSALVSGGTTGAVRRSRDEAGR